MDFYLDEAVFPYLLPHSHHTFEKRLLEHIPGLLHFFVDLRKGLQNFGLMCSKTLLEILHLLAQIHNTRGLFLCVIVVVFGVLVQRRSLL